MAGERVQRRLAAILAADVVGYSRLVGADEEGTLARLKRLRQEMIEPAVAGHGGRVVKLMGDGVLVEFASAVDAVQCAVEVQRALAGSGAASAPGHRIEFRIGINLGDVVVDGDDILGDGVNIAARLEGLCEPGEICISGTVHDHVHGKLALDFDDRGEQRLKNIDRPIRVYGIRDGARRPPARDRPAGPPLLRDMPAIAVLPFQNLSGDPEQEYFADGLSEDIITALSAWRSFPVIARNSTFIYKGRAVNVQQVGRELGAAYLLEGSVRKYGQRFRISAQLIDAASGNQVWAQRFDQELEDIFAVQDEITTRIAATVVPELEKLETRRSGAKQPRNLDAWDCYLRGLSFLYESTREGNVRAHAMFERALALDPAYGPAFAGMAYLLNRDLLLDRADSFDDTAARCLEMARRAVALDESASINRTELVRALLWTGQHEAAVAEARSAVENNPYSALGQFWLGAALAFAGREEEAIPWLERALELAPRDPRNQFFMTHLALAHLCVGQPEQALHWARRAALQDSDFVEAPLAFAAVLARLGNEAEARATLERAGVAGLGAVAGRPHWRRYRSPAALNLVLDGLRKAGLSD